jgi:transcriptional regulator of acetoin/glycerol metabolism
MSSAGFSHSSEDEGLTPEKVPAISPAIIPPLQIAWQKYIDKNVLDIQVLRPEVADSWQRCRNINVDPFPETTEYVHRLELKERRYRSQFLLKAARSFVESLYEFVRGSGFQVVLTDETGYLLDVRGDPEILARTESVHLCPGGNWNEAVRGTNAIGTAIFERRPVQVYACEHYCKPNHFLTCSAAPIFDPDGMMIGVLDISGSYRVANPHTLGMVVAAASAIESQLRLQKATSKLYTAFRYSNILLANMSDALISVDNQGAVTDINAKGAELFGVSMTAAKGRHISEISSALATVTPVRFEGVERKDEEIFVEKLGRKLTSSTSLLREGDGRIIGAVMVFRELRNKRAAPAPAAIEAHRITFADIVGESRAIRDLKAWAERAANCPSVVLLNGETGTGKELFAQAIHNESPRCDHPFVAINCAAMPESLVESELFGYEDGSFTGARKGGQPGKFELASGGTFFLDEVGDMSLAMQAKLLRVIQEMRVSRIGASHERSIDVRLIAATHRDLAAEACRGAFREDLYYRLNVLAARIPPLRERVEDLPVLAAFLARKIAAKLGRGPVEIAPDFVRQIQSFNWPGNVRELANVLERAIVAAGPDGVLTGELPLTLPLHPESPKTEARHPSGKHLREVSREIEEDLIREALAACEGNIQRTAAKLGICRNTLYRKMREFGIS